MNFRSIIKLSSLKVGSLLYNNDKSKILFYHDIFKSQRYTDMGTNFNLFKKHVDVIVNEGYEIVSHINKSERQVAIMLDDGFKGIYELKEYFAKQKIYPTIFLAVDLIGKDDYLTKEQILELQKIGFNFECHSWSHKDLTIWNEKELVRELGDSKEFLTQLLNKEITELCLPIGYYSDYLLSQIDKYGYKIVYSSIPGNFFEPVHSSLVSRNLVQFSSPKELKYILRGGGELLKSRYKKMHYRHNKN